MAAIFGSVSTTAWMSLLTPCSAAFLSCGGSGGVQRTAQQQQRTPCESYTVQEAVKAVL